MEDRYVLKKNDYYLADVNFEEDVLDPNILWLHDFTVDYEMMKLFEDFEKAEEVRKKIFIETGLNFTVKKFKN